MKNENLIYWKAIHKFNKNFKLSTEYSIDATKELLKAINEIKDLNLIRMLGNKKDIESALKEMKVNLKSINENINFSKSQIDSLEKFGISGLIDIDNISNS